MNDIFDLSCFDESYFIAIAIDRISSFGITNQVGGTACAHPVARGPIVPLPRSWLPDADPLVDRYFNKYDPEQVQAFLSACTPSVGETFEPLHEEDAHHEAIYRCRLAEAWVPVRVRISAREQQGSLLSMFAGERMILTYMNSD